VKIFEILHLWPFGDVKSDLLYNVVQDLADAFLELYENIIA